MTMQIKSIILYNADGEVRKIDFKLGSVNIITGRSNTGKTNIINIVDYCLGESKISISDGVIRDTVVWYAVLFQIGSGQVLVARSSPVPPVLSSEEVYVETGSEVQIPPLSRLVANANVDSLKQLLNQLLHISPNTNSADLGSARRSLEANVRHASIYCFLHQNVIANPSVLFHKQTEEWMPQTIRDTLPYFLGAVREDKLKLLQELRVAKSVLRSAQSDLAEAEALGAARSLRGFSLLDEARQVGLVEQGERVEGNRELLELLSRVAAWRPQDPTLIGVDRTLGLQHEIEAAYAAYQRANDALLEAQMFARETVGYSTEVSEQEMRLESVGVFGNDSATDLCPICLSKLDKPNPSVTQLNKTLVDVRNSLAAVVRDSPRLREHIAGLEREREELRQRVAQLRESLAAVQAEQTNAQEIRDANARTARVVGRISLYLETATRVGDQSDLQRRVDEAEMRVASIENELDPAEADEMRLSLLSSVSSYMTEWARRLQLEFAGYPYRLDIGRLTVMVDRAGSPTPMNRMGGGANWVGCHLVALLALHRNFVELSRPVPRFLILDQPTQVYYPPDESRQRDLDADELKHLNDEDRQAVSRMFDFLFDVCEQLAPNLQIIVTEHANLPSPRFQNAIIEAPWRGGKALIPTSWFADNRPAANNP